MKKYTVVKICDFGAGTLLGLSDEQAKRRSHAVDKTDIEGVYLTNQPVQFKVGETIRIDQEAVGKCPSFELIIEAEKQTKVPTEEPKTKLKQKKRNPGRKKAGTK